MRDFDLGCGVWARSPAGRCKGGRAAAANHFRCLLRKRFRFWPLRWVCTAPSLLFVADIQFLIRRKFTCIT
ncbi:hypothetical protein GQ55_1G289600 [Panicum hallii var. hallii]|uniref:Uncharacterized protein n=1 Tax=Panicum hallii var. hallii TaxID=1504633 RepID=A0A2T7F8L2_9POAL|nr:hypothetical protein GQ55_1G289600 [Panicum hallii var. hallii]